MRSDSLRLPSESIGRHPAGVEACWMCVPQGSRARRERLLTLTRVARCGVAEMRKLAITGTFCGCHVASNAASSTKDVETSASISRRCWRRHLSERQQGIEAEAQQPART